MTQVDKEKERKPQPKLKSKLGRNPLEKKRTSKVGRMVEASFDKPSRPVEKVQDTPPLGERIREMKISVNFKEIVSTFVDPFFRKFGS